MSQPTLQQVHVNKPLTQISVAYIQSKNDFVADKVFPMIPVMKQSDRYFTYTKDFWFRTQAQKRAPGSESAGSGFNVDSTPTYFCDVWAHHMDVADQTRVNADTPLDMDRDATMFVTQNLLLRREIEFSRKYFATGVWQGYKPGGVATDFAPAVNGNGFWSASNSDPMKDVDLLKRSVMSQTGYMPNTLVLSDDVFFALRNHPVVMDRIKYTQTGIVTEELLAALFGVGRILIAQAVLNASPEGASGSNPVGGSFNFINSNTALLVYSAPAPSIMQPSAGYTFSWNGLLGATAVGTAVSKFRMEQLKSDRVEGEMAFDMKLVSADLGCLLKNVLS